MIWFTSDTHFCHDRGFIYEPRGFDNVEDMNETIVKNWNAVVAPEDTVYLLGDVMLNNNERGLEFLNRLNGNIIIIRGNHDTNTRLNLYAKQGGKIICNYEHAIIIKYGKYCFYLSHYPTNTSNLENNAPLSQHLINLFGHTHQKTNFYNDIPYIYHVGLDSHNNTPVSAEEVLEDIRKKVEECRAML